MLIGAQTGGTGGCLQDAGDLFTCFRDSYDECFSDEQIARGPLDPNEKVVIAERFIQPDQLLVYPIHFENIGDIEARDVFVTDELDPNLDVSTLELLTPDGASFDQATRTVRWELLNRDLLPGETDNVLLSIKPLPGLPSGTEIRNDADIQFEVFDIFTTNEVVNIIDSTPPTCTLDPLPAETTTLDFPISWSGIDAIGEIESYTVFVSVDGGDFTLFLESTPDTSAVFSGEPGRTYGFLCSAQDTAGNTEVQEAVAEAVTHVATDVASEPSADVPVSFSLYQNYPNPFNSTTTIRFDVAEAVQVRLVIYDVLGRKVATLINSLMDPGRHVTQWDGTNDAGLLVAGGAYIYRIEAGAFTDTKTMTLMK